jgi:hypothetical protein
MLKVPKKLQKPGRNLWKAICQEYDVEPGAELVLGEICRLWDRLHEIRERLAADGLTLTEGEGARKRTRKHPLADLEPKISAAFIKAWKTAGLADTPALRPQAGRR